MSTRVVRSSKKAMGALLDNRRTMFSTLATLMSLAERNLIASPLATSNDHPQCLLALILVQFLLRRSFVAEPVMT